jgi:hypothetical protein
MRKLNIAVCEPADHIGKRGENSRRHKRYERRIKRGRFNPVAQCRDNQCQQYKRNDSVKRYVDDLQ